MYSQHGGDPIYLAVLGGADTAEFPVKNGWIDIEEDKNENILRVFEPDNQK